MATPREIRRRIRSFKSMGQITKAMQMVASSKMRRAQNRVLAARPYADKLRELVARLAVEEPQRGIEPRNEFPAGTTLMARTQGRSYGEQITGGKALKLLEVREVKRVGIVLISPDKGLCGALPGNVTRRAFSLAIEQNAETTYIAAGRKGRDLVIRNQQDLTAEFTGLGDQPSLLDTAAIARAATDAYIEGKVDKVYLVYTKFFSTINQRPEVVQLLPVEAPALDEGEEGENQEAKKKNTAEYIYEPDPTAIFERLLPRYIETLIYQGILESIASEFSARMVAMKNASDNASDLVDDLTLTYNKARQAAITKEILEVVSGTL